MTEEGRKEFGRRGQAPPVVTHAPEGLSGSAIGQFRNRKRSIAVALIAAGSLSLGTYAAIEHAQRRDCSKEGDWGRQEECRESHSHGGSSSSASHGSSSGASSSGSASGHAVSFGGFGGAGAGHGGGGS